MNTQSLIQDAVERVGKLKKGKIVSLKVRRSYDIGCVAGNIFVKEGDRWKNGIFSRSDEAIQEDLKMGLLVPVDENGGEIEDYDPEIDAPSYNQSLSDIQGILPEIIERVVENIGKEFPARFFHWKSTYYDETGFYTTPKVEERFIKTYFTSLKKPNP